MHTIGVDKITLFKTTSNNVLSPTCFDPHWIIIREDCTLLVKLLRSSSFTNKFHKFYICGVFGVIIE